MAWHICLLIVACLSLVHFDCARADGIYYIQQKGFNSGARSMRYLDGYDDDNTYNYEVCTRDFQRNPSQWWMVKNVGLDKYTIQQVGTNDGTSSMRYLDAYEDSGHDYHVVTRANQHNPSQVWLLTPTSDGDFRVQQAGTNGGKIDSKSNMRYLDAYESDQYLAVTRGDQHNPSQVWVFTKIPEDDSIMALSLIASHAEGERQRQQFIIVLGVCAGIAATSMLTMIGYMWHKKRSGGAVEPLLDCDYEALQQ